MTFEDLQRCDRELNLLVPRGEASTFAREDARSFNARVDDVRAALLEPARDLLRRDAPLRELAACLQKAVAELAFWRRVLLRVHPEDFGPEPAQSDYLVRWVMS